jgi:2-polyprenyl-3-methyl-5-hydroxy-6-metoxy-1,4-benzoquinol methylase
MSSDEPGAEPDPVRVRGRCPYCQSVATPVLRTKDYNQRITNDAFTYCRCGACGLLFLAPLPDDLGQYYPGTYYAIQPAIEDLRRIARRHRYQIDLVRKYVSGGRLLDIGPGQGIFAHLAKEAGFTVETIEMDEGCCAQLRDVLGVGAIQSDDPAAVLPSLAPQQVITMWHVVEHLPDPWLTLQRAADNLAPGGILLVAAPNPRSLQFRLFGPRWVHLDAPRHVQLIPVPLLVRHLAKLGLRPELVTANDQGGRMLNVYGWRASLLNLSTRRGYRAAAWRLGWLIGHLAGFGDGRFWPGTTYTAIFRKSSDDAAPAAPPRA